MHHIITLLLAAFGPTAILAHTAVFAPGMYCRGGPDPNVDNQNTNTVVDPLVDLSKSDWWFQHARGCDRVPPPAGEFLELPAGGEFQVELAHNRAFTTLSYDGKMVTDWPDGKNHPEDWSPYETSPGSGCNSLDGALHVLTGTRAAGTAWAISYESELGKVTMENLVVFSVLQHTPWKRLAKYAVPKRLPACPPSGCTCAWLWVPDGCGQSNIYMQGFKCKVIGAQPDAPSLAPAQPPVYCAKDRNNCTKGAKQMIAWKQLDGNNVFPPTGGPLISPVYNATWGFMPGAQDDIFVESALVNGTVSSGPSSSAASSTIIDDATPAGSPLSSLFSIQTDAPVMPAPVKHAVSTPSPVVQPGTAQSAPSSLPQASPASVDGQQKGKKRRCKAKRRS